LILFNVGAMEVELNHFAEGLDALQEYERSAPSTVVQARRAQIDALLERVRTRSGTITVALAVEGLRVQIEAVGSSGTRFVREGAAAQASIRVPIGRYRIAISANGFRPREVEQDVASNSDLRIDRALDPMVATLSIRSNVEAAEVKIDGRLVGTTPLASQQVPEGAHRIEVSRAGYTLFATSVTAQGENGVVEANLQWAPSIPAAEAGRMALDREYQGVECSIDGQRVSCDGTDNVPPGPHMLRVTGRDYVPVEQRVRLDAGRLTRVELALTPTGDAIREQQERQSAHRRTGFIIGGVGLAMAIGGGVWFPLAFSSYQRVDDDNAQFNMAVGDCMRAGQRDMLLALCVNRVFEMMDEIGPLEPGEPIAQQLNFYRAESDGHLAQAIAAGSLIGVGVIGMVVGGVIIGTAPPDRLSNPPRRARLAPQFLPTLNGFGLRF
jgi:hypothetical protein